MELMIYTLCTFLGLLLIFQLVFFEINRSRAKKTQDLSWYLSLQKPYSYNRTGYMAVLCLICYLFNGVGTMFSMTWLIYLLLFMASGIVADAVVQYLVMQYGRIRCKKDILAATALSQEIEVLKSENMEEDHDYEVSVPQYDETAITKQYVVPTDHLAFMTVDKGDFVKAYKDYPELTFDVEPYSDTFEVQENLADLPVKATKLTSENQMPFKDERINVLMDQFSNYDKYEVTRVLKKDGYFIVHQNGTDNLKEFLSMYMPFGIRGNWNAEACEMSLKELGYRIMEKHEDYGYVRFHSLRQLHTYFKTVAPDVAENLDRYIAFYMNALKEIKEKSYYQITTYRFLVVAKNENPPVREQTPEPIL